MRGHRQEPRLGAVGGIGLIARLGQRALGLGAVGDVAADALHLGWLSRIVTDQAFAPCDPSPSQGTSDLLVMNPRAVRLKRALALLEHREGETAADQRAARLSRQFAIGVIDESDGA